MKKNVIFSLSLLVLTTVAANISAMNTDKERSNVSNFWVNSAWWRAREECTKTMDLWIDTQYDHKDHERMRNNLQKCYAAAHRLNEGGKVEEKPVSLQERRKFPAQVPRIIIEKHQPESVQEQMKIAAKLTSIPVGLGIAGFSAYFFNQKFPKSARAATACAQFGLSAWLAYGSKIAMSNHSEYLDELKDPKADQRKRESVVDLLKVSPYCILGSAAASYAFGRRGLTNAQILKNMIKNK